MYLKELRKALSVFANEEQGNGAGAGVRADDRANLCQQGGLAALLFQKVYQNLGIFFAIAVANKNGGVLFLVGKLISSQFLLTEDTNSDYQRTSSGVSMPPFRTLP